METTAENLERAKSFLIRKWQERAVELGRPIPQDLTNACKFSSMFAQSVFGGKLQGNWHHQFVQMDDGSILDLTGNIGPYHHDKRFWNNREHRESMKSCETRVQQWVTEFNSQDVQGKS